MITTSPIKGSKNLWPKNCSNTRPEWNRKAHQTTANNASGKGHPKCRSNSSASNCERETYETLEKSLHAPLTHGYHWELKNYKKHSIFNAKRGNTNTVCQSFAIQSLTTLIKTPTGGTTNAHDSLNQLTQKSPYCTEEIKIFMNFEKIWTL